MKKDEKVIDIRYQIARDEKDLREIMESLKRAMEKDRIPIFIEAIPNGKLLAPQKGRPYFTLPSILPAELFKAFDAEKLQKNGFSLGIGALSKLKIFLLILFPKDELSEEILATRPKEKDRD